MFEFISKLNLPFFTFHDQDIAPEGNNLQKPSPSQEIAEYTAKKMQSSSAFEYYGERLYFLMRDTWQAPRPTQSRHIRLRGCSGKSSI